MSVISELEKQRETMRGLVETKDRVERLFENADFKKLIREGFLVEECARNVRESIDPALPAEARAAALAMAQSAGYFKLWCNMQIAMGKQAELTIRDIEEALDQEREDIDKVEGEDE